MVQRHRIKRRLAILYTLWEKVLKDMKIKKIKAINKLGVVKQTKIIKDSGKIEFHHSFQPVDIDMNKVKCYSPLETGTNIYLNERDFVFVSNRLASDEVVGNMKVSSVTKVCRWQR